VIPPINGLDRGGRVGDRLVICKPPQQWSMTAPGR
jgi:hypothetical protein